MKKRMAKSAIAARACSPLLERAWRMVKLKGRTMNEDTLRRSNKQYGRLRGHFGRVKCEGTTEESSLHFSKVVLLLNDE